MKLKAYSNCVDSGVQWIGNTPEHWMVGSIKRFFDVVGGATPKSEVESYWDGEIIWITPTDLYGINGEQIKSSIRTLTNEGLNSCGTRIVPSGSIILSTRAPIGSVAIAEVDLCTNQGCKSLVPVQDKRSGIFIANLLSVSTSELNVRGKGTTFLELSGDELSSFKVPFPPIEEQIAINKFVFSQKAKLDTLISKQEKLIELLKEKRQAIISHAVTKGLDPDVQMKDSGIEWIGEIPEKWKVKRLSFVANERKESNSGMKEDNLLSLSYGNIIKKNIETLTGLLPESFETYQVVYNKDIIFRPTDLQNDKRSLRTAITNQKGIITSAYICIEPTFIIPKYFNFLLRSYDIQKVFYSMGGGLRQSIKFDDIKRMPILVPSEKEQQEICYFIDSKILKIDNLITKAKESIELAKEHRSALISAAVTGKIDVRDFILADA